MFGIHVNRRHPLWRPLSARGRGLMLGLGLLLIPAVALAAWLLVVYTIAGSITAGGFGPIDPSGNPTVLVGDPDCIASRTDDTVTVTWTGVQPGEICRVRQLVQHAGPTGSANGYVKFAGAPPAGVLFSDLTCGLLVAEGAASVATEFELALDGTTSEPGGVYALAFDLQATTDPPTCP